MLYGLEIRVVLSSLVIFIIGLSVVGMEKITNVPAPAAAPLAVIDSKCLPECMCLSQTQVLCNGGNLNSIVERLPAAVEHFSLAKSDVPTTVKTESFAHLKFLSKLCLDGNNVSAIQQFAFKGLPKLQELSVQHTSLDKVDKFAFAGLQNVTAILLAHNRIRSIEAYSFAGTSHVRLILLLHNPLHVIHSNAFSGLRSVEHLILPFGIRAIESDAFNGLDSVGLVKLAFMDLLSLEPYTFRGLNHVHVLAIQESDLGIVRSRAFDGLTNVGTLNLINNKIDALQELRIRETHKVRIFRLVGNHLLKSPPTRRSSIDVRVSENFTVVGNHFPCDDDCSVLSLLRGPLANGTSYGFSSKNYCISPLHLNGRLIKDLKLAAVAQSSAAASRCGEVESDGDDNGLPHPDSDSRRNSAANGLDYEKAAAAAATVVANSNNNNILASTISSMLRCGGRNYYPPPSPPRNVWYRYCASGTLYLVIISFHFYL